MCHPTKKSDAEIAEYKAIMRYLGQESKGWQGEKGKLEMEGGFRRKAWKRGRYEIPCRKA